MKFHQISAFLGNFGPGQIETAIPGPGPCLSQNHLFNLGPDPGQIRLSSTGPGPGFGFIHLASAGPG